MLTDTARHRLMVATPLLFALLIAVLHPVGGGTFYQGIADNQERWIAMHLVGAVLFPAMAVVVWSLMRDLPSRAARVARFALAPYVVFYAAWEVVVGISTWVLVHDGQSEGAVNALIGSPIVGEGGVFNTVGSVGWITAAIAAAVAVRAAGASRTTVALVAAGSVMAMHVPPFGPLALILLAAGIHRVARRRAAGTAPVPTPTPVAA
jgi:hypothetical protein